MFADLSLAALCAGSDGLIACIPTIPSFIIESLLTSTSLEQQWDLIACWSLLFLILYGIFWILFSIVPGTGLQGDHAKTGASRCISTIHAALVVGFGIVTVIRQNRHWTEVQHLGRSTPLELRVLEISAGFFLIDLALFFVSTGFKVQGKQSVLTFCHHAISSFFMISCGSNGHAGSIVMIGVILTECTSPIVTAWTLAKAAKSERHLVWLSPLFTVVFSIMRLGAMTAMLWHAIPALLIGSNPGEVHIVMRLAWAGSLLLLVLGGWIWSIELIKGLQKFNRQLAKDRASRALLNAQLAQVLPLFDETRPLVAAKQLG